MPLAADRRARRRSSCSQPDLGSAALLVLVTLTMLVLGGVQLRWLALLASPVVAAGAAPLVAA